MLGLDNPLHIAFILILLLLVFGAKRLPEMGKSLGTGLRGFKDSLSNDAPPSTLTEARTETPVEHPADAARTPVQPVA
ncbi:MAG: twin-arginine translocase TatA/TatE family subunit [Solirubrobacteraceae bacterium]